MKWRCMIVAAGVWLAAGSAAWAFDTVKLKPSGTVVGTVKAMSPLEVTVEQNSVPRKVPVNQIASIIYDGEPSSLNIARTAARRGQYEDALALLTDKKKIPADERREVNQDVEFLTALCTAKLALGGNGQLKEAGRMMVGFINSQSGSYHYLEACQLLGDLYVAAGAYSNAAKYYRELAKAPWPDYKMLAGVAVGRAQLAEKKLAEAEKSFDEVLAIDAEGDLAAAQKLAATLGKARCMAEKGQAPQAKKMVLDVIAKADPEDNELHSRAYNTLGTIERKAGNTKEAILAFLHVDVLYFSQAEQHAEALANLEALWTQINKQDRANQARRILDENYKNSPWARQKGG